MHDDFMHLAGGWLKLGLVGGHTVSFAAEHPAPVLRSSAGAASDLTDREASIYKRSRLWPLGHGPAG